MLRQAANNIQVYNAHYGIASYAEKRTETSIKKQLQKIEKEVEMEYQKSIRVVRMVTKVKGRRYFFIIIKKLINITISSVWQINNRRLRTQRSRDDP